MAKSRIIAAYAAPTAIPLRFAPCPVFGKSSQALGRADLGHVAEIARGWAHVVPVRGRQLLGQEARQRRLALQGQQVPCGFAGGADGIGRGERQRLVILWAGRGQA